MKTLRLEYPVTVPCRVFVAQRFLCLSKWRAVAACAGGRTLEGRHRGCARAESSDVWPAQPELAAQGFAAGRDRIVRLRHELALRCKQKRKFKATTNSNHDLPMAENLLNQTFTPTRPNEAWVPDNTYVAMGKRVALPGRHQRHLHLRAGGLCDGRTHDATLTAQALWKAVLNKRPAPD